MGVCGFAAVSLVACSYVGLKERPLLAEFSFPWLERKVTLNKKAQIKTSLYLYVNSKFSKIKCRKSQGVYKLLDNKNMNSLIDIAMS